MREDLCNSTHEVVEELRVILGWHVRAWYASKHTRSDIEVGGSTGGDTIRAMTACSTEGRQHHELLTADLR